jgi:hypothetical protein
MASIIIGMLIGFGNVGSKRASEIVLKGLIQFPLDKVFLRYHKVSPHEPKHRRASSFFPKNTNHEFSHLFHQDIFQSNQPSSCSVSSPLKVCALSKSIQIALSESPFTTILLLGCISRCWTNTPLISFIPLRKFCTRFSV